MQKAQESEHLSTHIDLTVPSAPNWAIVMIFYAALHYVEAYFFVIGAGYRKHVARDTAIRGDAKIGKIWRDYERLKTASLYARYDSNFFSEAQFRNLIPKLEQVKAVITPLI